MVLLRCGTLSPSASGLFCFALRVVKARARDMLPVFLGEMIVVKLVLKKEREVLCGRGYMASKKSRSEVRGP